ncbi:ThuA domain-containing protein [Georgenia sp. MJ170]
MARPSSGRHWATRAGGALLAGVLALPLVASGASAQNEPLPEQDAEFSALVFSKTAGFRHDSIEAGVEAIEQLGEDNGFSVDHTEEAADFTTENLSQYDVVVWLSTTGDVLNGTQQTAFESYIQNGGGYAGIHAASDTEYDWEWYGDLVGAYFSGHPPGTPDGTVVVEDHAHPSTEHLPARWDRTDEWYSFRDNPRGDVHVLASLDESTYDAGGNAMGDDHPIAWCHDYDGGRSWYTGGGHTDESFAEPAFLTHVLKGLQTAAGVVGADCTASLDESFDKVALDLNTQNPMDLAPTPDGRAIFLERDGRVQIVAPNGGTTTAGTLPVTQVQEFGLLGLELDPDFADNGWIYLYYSPEGSTADYVSRFTLEGDVLDMDSEEVLLEVEVQRDECCHAGGALQFDGDGNLYIATGDNTNPFASDGYSPIDEREGRAAWDAQGTSGNTNDLRGKILRITPQDDGSIEIPEGNLFAPGTDQTRPEIFAMGFRNPFKIGLDPRTGTLLVADYGPDAGSANPNRGPAGIVEWNVVGTPGNYGWPHCVGGNLPYISYDFAGGSGDAFDCENGPTNDSPNNTGLTTLPPAIPATVWYQNNGSTGNAPEIGNGGAPMAGSVYVYDEDLVSERKWPAYWDGKAAFAEWNTGKLFSFQMSDDTSEVVDINQILSTMSFARPHALEWGADGALYMIEWGSGFGGNNADSGVYRIDYISGSRAPIARAEADVTSGPVPLTVQFSSEGSRDPDGGEVTLEWDFGDGETSTEANPTYTYTTPGNYTATLTVTNEGEQSSSASVPITAGNTAPVVTVETPPNGGFFNFGDVIEYSVTVTDPEDGEIDCENVIVQPALGHDEHAHPYDQYFGCEGAIPLHGDTGHIGANIFGVITVTYTDQGAEGVAPLTTQEVIILQPKRKEAEYFSETGRLPGSTSSGDAGVQTDQGAEGVAPLTTQEVIILQPKRKEAEYFSETGRLPGSTSSGDAGVQTEDTEDVGGGQNIGFAEVDDWFSFDPTNLTNIDGIRLRAATELGGTVDIRTGAPDGPSIGSVTIPADGWQAWGNYDLELPDNVTTETAPLYFVITEGQANINWVEFIGQGVTDNASPVVEATASETSGPAPLTVDFTATATDPDGDTPLTYAWDFGDGETADTAEASHTYTAAGSYAATVTVTDARGATNSESVEITVTAAAMKCFAGRSDDFTGDTLDTDRWDGVVRANQDLRVEDGSLIIPTVSSDIYGTDNQATPNIVLQDLPEGPFTATTKVTMPGSEAYQQAGLVIYGDDDNYAKMVLSGRDTAGPNPASRVFQLIREENAEPNEVNASLTAALGADYPTTVWVRFTSDGENLVASYSADGVEFTDMSETKSLDGIDDPKIGLISLQGNGRSQAPVDAAFDYFTITPDDTVPPIGPNDDFDGTVLDGCRWDVVRPDAEHLRVADGHLEIDAVAGDVYGTDNTDPSNFVLQQLEGDWTVETLVDASAFGQQYEQAGLIAYGDDDNYVKIDTLTTNTAGGTVARGLEIRSEIDGVVQDPQPSASELTHGVWHLRLQKQGDTFTGSYSADGETWTEFESLTNAAVASSGRVGLFALGAASTASPTATFDYFRVVGDDEPVLVEVTPAEVTFTDEAGTEDDSYTIPEVEGVEYVVDGDVVAADTYPGTGTVTVTARALDGFVLAEGATAEWTHEFSTDSGEPVLVEVTPAEVTFDEQDGTEGDSYTIPEVEGVEYVVDGDVVAADTYPGTGTVTVTARALDGFVLAEGATAEWSHEFSAEGGEPVLVEVTPAEVTFDEQDGTEGDSYTIPEVEGVEYVVDGDVVAADTYPGTGTVTVTARALDGFVLAEGATAEWTHEFSTEGGGEVPQPPSSGAAEFHLSDNWRGTTHHFFKYGRIADEVFVGDWDGDGVDSIALRRGNTFHVSNAPRGGDADWTFRYGRAGDTVLVGDWNGDGTDTFAVRRGNEYHVKNHLLGGDADVVFNYGRADDDVLVGDWNGDGTDTFAVRRGNEYHVKNHLLGGDADVVFNYGRADDDVLVGDWDGDDLDTLAVRRGATYHVKNSTTGGDADWTFTYGRAADVTLVGDWNGDGLDTLAVRRGATYHVKNALTGGDADLAVNFGRANDEVFVGDWNGDGSDTLGIRRGRPAPDLVPPGTQAAR